MTDEQKIFYVGKREIARLDILEKERPLTLEESENREKIKEILFATVVRFGMQKARERMRKYRIPQDAYQDVQQELAVIFYEKLPAYNPTESTPTTYFLRYFQQVISQYLLQDSQHLSQYDAHNVSLVRGAIQEFESRGIQWDEHKLSDRTGLSLKVVKNTLYYERNSIYADVDDAIELSSEEPTPEEYYIRKECNEVIRETIQSTLTPFDFELLMYKLNPDEPKERSYHEVATHFGLPLQDARKYWEDILAKLREINPCAD